MKLHGLESPQRLETPIDVGQVFFDGLSLIHHPQEDGSARPHELTPQHLFPYLYAPPSYPY